VTFRQSACGRQNRFKCGEFGPGLQRLVKGPAGYEP